MNEPRPTPPSPSPATSSPLAFSAVDAAVPEVSATLLGAFLRYVEPYLRRHFHALRLARTAGSAAAVSFWERVRQTVRRDEVGGL